MINNFDQIVKLLSFNNEDEFYHLQILKRKKEHPDLGNNSVLINTYYIKSEEDLRSKCGEIKLLCDYHNARACINLNKRSFKRTAFNTLRKITDQICNNNYKDVRRAYNSTVGEFSCDEVKKWIVDIDHKNMREINDIIKFAETLDPQVSKFIDLIETKNGYHAIMTPFNRKDFSDRYPNIDIQKDNPTILYIP